MTRLLAGIGVAAVIASGATTAAAQGTLSTQGLGYPPGQLSTAARTMGGSIGAADPFSPLNPAAIALISGAVIMMQAEPEYRVVEIGPISTRTSVARFPLFQGALQVGSRWGIAISSSTLLDRTWETTTRDTQTVAGEDIAATVTEHSDGSIADTRLALAYSPRPWLKIGIGGHAFSGRDQLHTIRAFDDSLRFVTDTQRTVLSFGGNAVSVGAVIFTRKVIAGATYRAGGGISSETGAETVGTGQAPDHIGFSLVYAGVRGAAFAVRAAKDGWSSLRGMADNLNIHEGWDIGVGSEVDGPNVGASSIAFRFGARWRTLPFSLNATPVKERTLSTGFAIPMARNRIDLHMGGLYAKRTNAAVGGIQENAWTISTGFSVRP